jgi:hypothetical protein
MFVSICVRCGCNSEIDTFCIELKSGMGFEWRSNVVVEHAAEIVGVSNIGIELVDLHKQVDTDGHVVEIGRVET